MNDVPGATSLDGFHDTEEAQHADEQVRALFEALTKADLAGLDDVLPRGFLSYDVHGLRTRTGFKAHLRRLRQSFSDLSFVVHENVGVLVDGDLVATRVIMRGTHTGDFAGHAATGRSIETSASHVFRVREGRLVEHWPIVDTYRILVTIGAVAGSAGVFQDILGAPQTASGLFDERPGTPFGVHTGRPGTREESREAGRRLWEGVVATGDPGDVDSVAEGIIANSGWIPDGREFLANALAAGRAVKPDGSATPTHVVAEGDRVAFRSVWDGNITTSGRPADHQSVDFFRVEDGLLVEHWETVDFVRLYQGYGLLGDDVQDE